MPAHRYSPRHDLPPAPRCADSAGNAHEFFSNDAWQDYDDLARTLMMAVDAIIEAEREITK
jgi:hypothetical protein